MRIMRALVTLSYDGAIAAASFLGALWIRYDGALPKEANKS